MIKAKVNQSEFDVEIISETEIKLNSESNQLDVISLSNSKKHLILGNKSYSIEYVSFDKEKILWDYAKKFKKKVFSTPFDSKSFDFCIKNKKLFSVVLEIIL